MPIVLCLVLQSILTRKWSGHAGVAEYSAVTPKCSSKKGLPYKKAVLTLLWPYLRENAFETTLTRSQTNSRSGKSSIQPRSRVTPYPTPDRVANPFDLMSKRVKFRTKMFMNWNNITCVAKCKFIVINDKRKRFIYSKACNLKFSGKL